VIYRPTFSTLFTILENKKEVYSAVSREKRTQGMEMWNSHFQVVLPRKIGRRTY